MNADKPGPALRQRGGPLDPAILHERIFRAAANRPEMQGELAFRAIPSAADAYAEKLLHLFAALGKPFRVLEAERLRTEIEAVLNEKHEVSPEAQLVCRYSARLSSPIAYTLEVEPRSIAKRYERYAQSTTAPLFGRQPDARLLALLATLGAPSAISVLDVGAGSGRNAIPLALRGHPVHAVELTPQFQQLMRADAAAANANVNVIAGDFLDPALASELGGPHAVVLASEMVPHIADEAALALFFARARQLLSPEGHLLINGFVADPGFLIDSVAREASAAAWSTIFTEPEYVEAAEGFTLRDTADAVAYERARWPASDWPPTPWYEGWAGAGDVFDGPGPAKLCWLLFQRIS